MEIGAVVGMAGWFLKVSGGQVKTCPADLQITAMTGHHNERWKSAPWSEWLVGF
jgi:hypothetical protein